LHRSCKRHNTETQVDCRAVAVHESHREAKEQEQYGRLRMRGLQMNSLDKLELRNGADSTDRPIVCDLVQRHQRHAFYEVANTRCQKQNGLLLTRQQAAPLPISPLALSCPPQVYGLHLPPSCPPLDRLH